MAISSLFFFALLLFLSLPSLRLPISFTPVFFSLAQKYTSKWIKYRYTPKRIRKPFESENLKN